MNGSQGDTSQRGASYAYSSEASTLDIVTKKASEQANVSVNINGKAAQAQTLKASTTIVKNGAVIASPKGTYKYQWLREGQAINGATADTYALSQLDVGTKISTKVTYTEVLATSDSEEAILVESFATSTETTPVNNVNDLPTGSVTISIGGEVNRDRTQPRQGDTLIASNTIQDIDGISGSGIRYQWKANGQDIIDNADANRGKQASILLKQSEVGKQITVVASYIDDQGTKESVSSGVTQTVTNINDRPILDTQTALSITSLEDAFLPSGPVGSLVSTLVAGISDPDGIGADKGIAITGIANELCVFYYSTNGGSTWSEITNVSESNALLLTANTQTRVYIKPRLANDNGNKTNQITIKAWDGTTGSNGNRADSRETGRSDSPFSAEMKGVSVQISPVNDAPLITNLETSEVYTEDTPYVLKQMQVSDIDSSTIRVVLRLSDPKAGTLSTSIVGSIQSTFNVATGTWEAIGDALSINNLLKTVIYVPSSNFNNTFQILTTVSDGTDVISGVKQFIGRPVNDAPMAADDLISVTREPSIIKTETLLSNDFDIDDQNGLKIVSISSRDSSRYTASLVRDNNNNVTGIEFNPIDPNLEGIAVLDYKITDGEYNSEGVLNLLVGGISIGSQSNTLIEQGSGTQVNDKTTINIGLSDGYKLDASYLVWRDWTSTDGGQTYNKNGIYGKATLDVIMGKLSYTLDNTKNTTNQLKTDDIVNENLGKIKAGKAELSTISSEILIKIIGSNDAPTSEIGAQSSPAVEAGFNIIGNSTAKIKINTTDAEGEARIDTQDLTSSAKNWKTDMTGTLYTKQGIYGIAVFNALTKEVVYTLDNERLSTQSLSKEQKVFDSFGSVKILDEDNIAVTTEDILFQVVGSNDSPFINTVQQVNRSENQAGNGFTETQPISYGDIDNNSLIQLEQIYNFDIKWDRNSADSVRQSLALPGDLIKTLTNDFKLNPDKLSWTYKTEGGFLGFLRQGESITYSYTIVAKDQHGAEGRTIVRFTINGESALQDTPPNIIASEIEVNEASDFALFKVQTKEGSYIRLSLVDSSDSSKTNVSLTTTAKNPADVGSTLQYYDPTNNTWINYEPNSNLGFIRAKSNEVEVRVFSLNDGNTQSKAVFEGQESLTLKAETTDGLIATQSCVIRDDGLGSIIQYEKGKAIITRPDDDQSIILFDNDGVNRIVTSNNENYTFYASDGRLNGVLPGIDLDKNPLQFSILGVDNRPLTPDSSGVYAIQGGNIRLISSKGTFTFTPNVELANRPPGSPKEGVSFKFRVTEKYPDPVYGTLDPVTGKRVSFNILDQTATIDIIYAEPGESPTITAVSSVTQSGIEATDGEILSVDLTPTDLNTRVSNQIITVSTSDTRQVVGLQVIDEATGLIEVDKPSGFTNAQITKINNLTRIDISSFNLGDGKYSVKLYYKNGNGTVLSKISADNSAGKGATFTINSTPVITEYRDARKTVDDIVYGSLSLASENGDDLRSLNLKESSSPLLTEDGDTLTTLINGESVAIEVPEEWQDTDGDLISFGLATSKANGDVDITSDNSTESTTVTKANGAMLTIDWNNGTYLYDISNRVNTDGTIDIFTATATDPRNSQGTLNLVFDVLDILPQDRLPDGVFNSEKQAELDQLLINQIRNLEISPFEKQQLLDQLQNAPSSGNPGAKVSQFENPDSPLSVFRVSSEKSNAAATNNGLTISNIGAVSSKNKLENAIDLNSNKVIEQEISDTLADLDDDELSALKATLEERFNFNIDDGITGLVNSLYGGKPDGLASSLELASGQSDAGLPIFSFDLNTNTGNNFTDSDPDRPGFQINVTLDLTSANLQASTLNSFQKVVSAAEFIKYAVWLSSLDPEVRNDNLFIDTSGIEVTAPGRYNFLRTKTGGDGAVYETYNRIINGQNVQYIKSVNLIITDNKFGDFSLAPGKDYITGDGSISDPGAPIYTASSSSSSSTSSSGASSSSPTSLGIFEVANSDEETSSTSETATSTNQENATLATVTPTVETVTLTDTSGGGGEGKNLVKGLKQSSQDELRAWAKRLGLLQGLDRLGVMDENGNAENRKPSPLDFINQKLGIDPERSSDLLNALVFGGASIYIINKTNPGLFKQWADALWSTKTNQTRNINRANKVIAIFLMRSTASLDRLVAVELHDDAIEILAEEKLLFSLDSAAQRHQASFENQLRRLCLKLENIGLPIQELLLLDPELKSAVTIVEHLSQETKIMEPNCLGDVVQQLSTTEMDQLQAWLTKPSSNPLDGHPIKSNLQKRQNELGLQLSSEKANVASLIELSLAMGMRQPAMSLV